MRLALLAVAALVAATAALLGGSWRGGEAEAAPLAGQVAVARGFEALEQARVRVDPSRYPVAERAFREALSVGGADAGAFRGLAALAAARHRFAESLRLARRARDLAPENPGVYGLIGDANVELGRFPAAHAAFDRMVRLKPSAPGYARIAYARELIGDTAGAIDAMAAAADAAGPGEPSAWALTQLGNLSTGSNRLDRGVTEYRRALERVPGYAPALAGLADVAQRRGNLPAAERLLRRSLARIADPGAAATLGDVVDAQGRADEAARWWARSLALEAEFRRYGGRNDVETALFDLDHDRNLGRALTRARAGVRDRPGVEGLHTYAWALYKNGHCREAVPYSDRALALAPTDVGALFHRALIERCLERPRESSRYRERARALDPTAAEPSAYRLP